jgi:hypothetical protein
MTQDQPLHERLVAALRARLEVARALGGETWYPAFYSSMDEWRVRDRRTQEPRAEVVDDDSAERRAQFIVANDPATEIRRVEALLRVVERHAPQIYDEEHQLWNCAWCSDYYDQYPVYPCKDIRDLAAGEGIEP